MEFTGERVVFDKMNNNAAEVRILRKHLERYVWALQFVMGKSVLDASCGTGYGTWLLSLVAGDVIGIDKDADSILYAEKQFPLLAFEQIDLERQMYEIEGGFDTIVSLETIEHLERPENFLEAIKGKELIFSIPINSPSEFHKHVYKGKWEIKTFIESFGWEITDEWLQDNKYFVGRAV